MPIAVACSSCASKFKAPDHAAGRSAKCPKCGAPLVVPAANSSPKNATGASIQVDGGPPKRAVSKIAKIRLVEEPESLDVLAAAQRAVPPRSDPAPPPVVLQVLPLDKEAAKPAEANKGFLAKVVGEFRRLNAEAPLGVYVGKYGAGRLANSHLNEAQKLFFADGERPLAIVKGRVKAHSTRTDGFFGTSEHATDKGGSFLNHFLIVTDRQVILWARGLFKSSSDCFDYSDITGIEQQKSGLFYGAVVLNVHGNKVNFAEMWPDEAVLVAGIIKQQKQRAKEGHQAGASRPDNDPAAQLEKLAGLLEKGLITRNEFEEKKRKLLAQI